MEYARSTGAARWNRMATGALVALAISVLPLSAASASGPKKHSVTYFNLHPCSLLSPSLVQSVIGTAVGPGQATPSRFGGGQCEYQTTTNFSNGDSGSVTYSFATESASKLVQNIQTTGPIVKEPSVGHGAVCQVRGGLFVNVPKFKGSAESLNIVPLVATASESCADAVKLAKKALLAIS